MLVGGVMLVMKGADDSPINDTYRRPETEGLRKIQ